VLKQISGFTFETEDVFACDPISSDDELRFFYANVAELVRITPNGKEFVVVGYTDGSIRTWCKDVSN
jgi:hypothetical protein